MTICRSIRSLAPALLLALASGCASFGLKQSLDPQLDQVEELRAQLAAEWDAIGSELDDLEREVAAFGARRIDTEKVDPAVLEKTVDAIRLPEDATAEDVEETGEEVRARMAAYRDSLEELDDDLREEVEQWRDDGARLVERLHQDLPASLAGMTERADEIVAELAEIRIEAEQVAAAGEHNPLMSASEKRMLVSDMAALDRKLESLAGLATQIAEDSVGYAERLAAAGTTFDLHVTSLGR